MPSLEQSISQLLSTIARLRSPEGGCPWDLEQDFESLRSYMIEEAYEASQAMSLAESNQVSPKKTEDLRDELGDVLLQVVLNAQIASERKMFDFAEIAQKLNEKMIRRHPHVFDKKQVKDMNALYEQWDSIKSRESSATNEQEENKKTELEKKYKKLKSAAPPSKQAIKVGKLTAKIGFDWDNADQVVEKLEEEIAELKQATASKNTEEIKEEIGDLYFTLHQVCRHLSFDPEVVSQDANRKFMRRFDKMVALCGDSIDKFGSLPKAQKEAMWMDAKK